MKKINTTAYHPQTDGLVERFNRTLTSTCPMSCLHTVQVYKTPLKSHPSTCSMDGIHCYPQVLGWRLIPLVIVLIFVLTVRMLPSIFSKHGSWLSSRSSKPRRDRSTTLMVVPSHPPTRSGKEYWYICPQPNRVRLTNLLALSMDLTGLWRCLKRVHLFVG